MSNRVRRQTTEQPAQPADTVTSLVVFPFRFSDLPLEILQQIFLYCSEPSNEGSPPSRHHKVTPEWLPITQVCRAWRSVAHDYPLLWSLITPNLNNFWVDVLQQRSKPLFLDVHLRVGRRDIDDRQVTMTAYAAVNILRGICHRIRSLRLDGPREHVQSTLLNLHTPSSLQSLSINIPLWDLGAPFKIPDDVFAFEVSVRSLSFSADRALHAPDWLLRGLTSFKTGGKVPLLDLLDALRQMPALRHFTLFKCTAVWDEADIFPGSLISMNRLEEFIVRTEHPRHFVLLATHLAIPDAARKRLAVHTLAAPGSGAWTTWLEALPPLYAARTRGGLQHIRISGGPTRGCFIAWTDECHDEMARFCFELRWNGSPPAQGGVRAIELESPFYHLHTLCDELEAGGVRRVLVNGDPSRIVVAKGYWRQLLSRLPNVEELWLYPGTAEVLCSGCAPPGPESAERVLQLLARVYVVEGRLSAPQLARRSTDTGPIPGETYSVSSSQPLASLVSPSSNTGLIAAEGEFRKREESHSLDMTPGLMALLRGGAAQSREVHLRNCEVEDGVLAPLCALAKLRRDQDWVPMGI